MTTSLIDTLLDITGIKSKELVWLVGFKTRRKTEGEVVEQTKFKGSLEEGYVWEISPRTLMDFNQIRFNRIYTEMNDIHIPLLEEDVSGAIGLVRGTYKREKTRRFGKEILDEVTIDCRIEYKDGRIVKYEDR